MTIAMQGCSSDSGGTSQSSDIDGTDPDGDDTTMNDVTMDDIIDEPPDETGTTPMVGHLSGRAPGGNIEEYNAPVVDADVVVLDIDPPLEAVSGEDGTFTMDVPHGLRMFRIEHPDYWSLLSVYMFRSVGETNVIFPVPSRRFFEDMVEVLGRPIDPDLGMVEVSFSYSPDGGESATISADYADALVFKYGFNESIEPSEGNALPSNGPNSVFFTNIEPGTTTVEVTGREGITNCGLKFGADEVAEWPVVAGAVTLVEAACRPVN